MSRSDKPSVLDEQIEPLLQAVERIRKERYPALDADLVRAILRLHSDAAAPESDVSREVEQLAERRLEQER